MPSTTICGCRVFFCFFFPVRKSRKTIDAMCRWINSQIPKTKVFSVVSTIWKLYILHRLWWNPKILNELWYAFNQSQNPLKLRPIEWFKTVKHILFISKYFGLKFTIVHFRISCLSLCISISNFRMWLDATAKFVLLTVIVSVKYIFCSAIGYSQFLFRFFRSRYAHIDIGWWLAFSLLSSTSSQTKFKNECALFYSRFKIEMLKFTKQREQKRMKIKKRTWSVDDHDLTMQDYCLMVNLSIVQEFPQFQLMFSFY